MTVAEQPKRYGHFKYSDVSPHTVLFGEQPNGDYVKFSDFASLSAMNEAMRTSLKDAAHRVSYLLQFFEYTTDYAAMRAELAQWDALLAQSRGDV